MSKKIESLQKQKAAIEAQIKQAEQMSKNKNRVDKLTLKVIEKHPALFSVELSALEKALDKAFTAALEELDKSNS